MPPSSGSSPAAYWSSRKSSGLINWEFLPTKQYDPDDFEAFLKLLPAQLDGRTLRHVVEVRHPSFVQPGFIALLRRYGVAAVMVDHETYPQLSDPTASFVYARLQRASEQEQAGYPPNALATWAERARTWAAGESRTSRSSRRRSASRHVARCVHYVINGFKPKAPAAAMALIERLSSTKS